MKRCPQCEFIYEDDQSLCDMDGVLLVFDSRSLPNRALATVSAPVPGKAQRRSRMAPAFATLILMLAIGSGYYVATLRNSAQPNSPASVTTETHASQAPAAVPASSPEANEASEVAPAESKPADTDKREQPAAAPPARKSTTATKPIAVKPAPKKDDSKVGSILKKTGKLLKKPFKF
jgi:hypothetical protein